jgi:hypothetical protein
MPSTWVDLHACVRGFVLAPTTAVVGWWRLLGFPSATSQDGTVSLFLFFLLRGKNTRKVSNFFVKATTTV